MISLNITIHNKAFLLPEFLERIKRYTAGPYEVVFVLDGCIDDSEMRVEKWSKENYNIKTKILTADNVFETKANNLAAKASESNHIIIIQDDVLINENEWNYRLMKPFEKFEDVFAVTGNCAHNWEFNHNSIDKDRTYEQSVESDSLTWCDILNHIQHANRQTAPRDIFSIRDSCNRAPLAINHGDLKKLNYFDEEYAPQDMDDADLMFRAKKQLGKLVGCYWIDYDTKPEWGGTRDEKGKTKSWLFAAHHKNTRFFYNRHRDMINLHSNEYRII